MVELSAPTPERIGADLAEMADIGEDGPGVDPPGVGGRRRPQVMAVSQIG